MRGPVGAGHRHVLPTGKVLFMGEWLDGAKPPVLWDPATNEVAQAPYAGYNVFCSGHSFLADGELLFAGGHVKDDYGFPLASTFDPFTGAWKRMPDMNSGR